jgi:TRAP-type C4-dicarboxylate transport system substrate-binding protein
MKKRTLLIAITLSVLFGAFFIMNPISVNAEPKVIKWRVQEISPPTSFSFKELSGFKKMVEEMSNGRMEIELYHGGQLAKATSILEAVQRGVFELLSGCPAYWQGAIPEAAVEYGLPFSARDAMEAEAILRSEAFTNFYRQVYAEKNLVYLGTHIFNPWRIYSNKPIRSVEDFKGLKVRGVGAYQIFLSLLGAKPVSIFGSEIDMAMQLGTIDACGWNSDEWSTRFKQVAKYYVCPPFGYPTGNWLVNKKAWDSLPQDLKAIIECAKNDYFYRTTRIGVEAVRLQEAEMPSGVMLTLPESDHKKLREAALKTWEKVGQKSPKSAEAVEIIKKYLKKHGAL